MPFKWSIGYRIGAGFGLALLDDLHVTNIGEHR